MSARTPLAQYIAALLIGTIFFALSAERALAAVTFGSVGTVAAGTNSLSIAYPASISAGDLLVMTIANKHVSNAPTIPTGWQAVANGQGSGGIGSDAADTGTVYSTVFVRIADGTESGNVSVTITSGVCAVGAISRYAKDTPGAYWSFEATHGTDQIGGSTAWSATGTSTIGITSGDMVITASAINIDTLTFSSQSMSATDATLGSHTERIDNSPNGGTTSGNDCKLVLTTHAVTAGTASAAPVFTMTANSSGASVPTGATVFLRIREVSAPTADGLTISNDSTITGALSVLGTLAKGSGTFAIDHPLDPINKILYHSFVESPDVKNIYDGIATLDKNGEAIIELPGYFLALNKDFRYLGTPIGQPMPGLFLSRGVQKRFFGLFGALVIRISGGAAHGRVSWQVTGIRKDPFIMENPIVTEVEKGPDALIEKGEYICEECYRNE